MRPRLAIVVISVGTLMLIPVGASADALPGGCAAFGANVAELAEQGPAFGALASSTASSGALVFRDNVVKREQAELCSG